MTAIDLARAAPFVLGTLEVRPATREVSVGGASEVLQPRIMQVLVALGARPGDVVSRDELIALCWDGQVVGDDAINRCIAKLRQLGETHSAFEIVTIARVGYRLTVAGAAAPAAVKSDATPVLAVLPFENLSSDPEMQFFSDGVSEEILGAVARIAGLRVIASASSFSFRGARKSEAARTLGATYVLDGSVRRGDVRVRIAAQLSTAAGGEVIWSEHYEREIVDVLAVQDEIASMIARALSTRLFPSMPKQQVDAHALDLHMHALTIRRAFDPTAQEKAIAYLRASLSIEPGFSRARAALAFTLCHRIVAATAIGAPPSAFDAAIAEVQTEARRTLELDPANSEANFALLSLQPTIGNWTALETAINAALETAPNDALLTTSRARLLFGAGRTRAAYDLYAESFASDPLSPRAMGYEALRRAAMLDDTSGARALVDRAFALASTDPIVWRLRQAVLSLQQDWDEAIRMLASGLLADQTAERMAHARRGYEHRQAGRPSADHPMLQHGPVLMRQNPFVTSAIVLGMIVTSDRYDAAFDMLDEAMTLHPPHKLWSQWNTEALNMGATLAYFTRQAAPFRAHARFLPLCANVGLCAYWAETGNWPDFIVDAPNRGELEARVRELAAQ